MKAGVHLDLDRQRLSPHFVYESYEANRGLFFNRGSIGFILKGWPLVGTSLQAQGEISEFLKDQENLPSGSSFQVLMVGSRHVDSLLDRWERLRSGEMFQKLARSRVQFLKSLSHSSGRVKDVFLFLSITVPCLKNGDEDADAMVARRERLKNSLRSMNLYTQDVSDKDLLEFLRLWFEWSQESHTDLNPHESLSEQVLPFDLNLLVEEDKLLLKGQKASEDKGIVALETVKRPKSWRLPSMDLFLGNEQRRGEMIECEFIHGFTLIVLPHPGLEKAAASTKRESLMKNMKSGFLKWMPGLEEDYEEMNQVVLALNSGEGMVQIFQTTLLKDSVSSLNEHTQAFCAAMRRNGFHFVKAQRDHLGVSMLSFPMQSVELIPSYFRSSIGGIGMDMKKLGRGVKTVSGEAQALLPIVGEWKGDLNSPGLLLVGRRGQLMYWSPFGPVLIPQPHKTPDPNENFNLCIAGVSGGGKSVFMQEVMLSTLGVGGRVFVLDYGRSFKRSCQILGGQYIEFDLKHPLSLNPFSGISERGEDFEAREDSLSGLSSVLSTMAAPLQGTSDLQNAMLQKALRAVWNEKQSRAEITDIAHWLSRQEESYSKDLANMLYPFTKEGIYGTFFSGPSQVTLTSKIVVIETDHLRSAPALLAVVVQMMIIHINQTMVRGDRKYPFLIMIDEAWKLLQGKRSGEFIEEVGRIARKYKGSITLATQQLTDYFRAESPASEKAFENASWKAILKQNPDSLVAMQSHPKLKGFVQETWQLEHLQSVHSHPPHYSEVALFGPSVKGVVGKLMLDEFTKLLTSTNAEDYQALEDKTQQGMTITQAIEDVLKERGLSS